MLGFMIQWQALNMRNELNVALSFKVVAGQCPTWFFLKRDYYTWIVINVLIVFIGKNCDVMVRSHALSLKVQGLILFVIFFSWTNEKRGHNPQPTSSS